MITWITEKRKLSELIPASYNPRELTEIQAKDLSTSLERFNLEVFGIVLVEHKDIVLTIALCIQD